MHSQAKPESMQDQPEYADIIDEITAFFEERLSRLDEAGVPMERIVLDPGIGFGKTLEHNLTILREVERFKALGFPLYLGLSNKSLWQGLLGLKVDQRQNATQAATALMAAKGVAVHRVHEVEFARQALTIARELA
jgi:dihydropteroate synthase